MTFREVLGNPLPFVRRPGGGWVNSPLGTVVVYGVAIVSLALGIILLEVALGNALVSARSPGVSHSLEDAGWHLAAGFVLALPAARRTSVWLVPVLSLGVDADHIFGALLPTVTGRTAHAVFVVAMLAAVLYAVQGRSGALLAAGALVGHMAVDGGSFPLFGPVSTAVYPIPIAVAALLLAASSVAFFLAFRRAEDLWTFRATGSIAFVVAALVGAMLLLTTAAPFLGN